MGRGSQQKNDRPAHVFLKRATREQFREQRLRQGRMPVVGPARLVKSISGIANLPMNLHFTLRAGRIQRV